MNGKIAPGAADQPAASRGRYRGWLSADGIVRMRVMIPVERMAELRAIARAWRHEAKRLVEADRPTADQILRIHAVCRALRLRLPIRALQTSEGAAEWLRAQEPALGSAPLRAPRLPTS